ncbi:MAG: hypothetical protein ACP5VE_12885 [Chthonomonadales bacterium]
MTAKADAPMVQSAGLDRDTFLAIVVSGVAMSLGWGLRGQFGGPMGAMVPGAMVAMALALFSRMPVPIGRFYFIAASGALGFGIGGEETYMQTASLAANSATAAWGYLGLAIKGAEWGGLAGLLIGSALGGRRYSAGELIVGFNAALALAFPAYWIINVPKLIYFSGGSGRPRPEAWAALTTVWLVLLVLARVKQDHAAVRLSLFGALGCGVGFPLFQWVNLTGSRLLPATAPFMDWWKVVECGLGLAGGLALGWGWHRWNYAPRVEQAASPKFLGTVPFVLLCLDLLVFAYVSDSLGEFGGLIGKAPFLFIAPALWVLASRVDDLQLALGVFAPIAFTFWNVQDYWVSERKIVGVASSVTVLAMLSAACAWGTAKLRAGPRHLFLLVTWLTVACAWFKMLIPAPQPVATNVTITLVVQGIFTVMAAFLTWVPCPRNRTGGVVP